MFYEKKMYGYTKEGQLVLIKEVQETKDSKAIQISDPMYFGVYNDHQYPDYEGYASNKVPHFLSNRHLERIQGFNKRTLMCPECFEMATRIINKPFSLLKENKVHHLDDCQAYDKISLTYMEELPGEQLFYGNCKCGFKGFFIDLDPYMASAVKLCNTSGFPTQVCCQGEICLDRNYIDKITYVEDVRLVGDWSAYAINNPYITFVDDNTVNSRVIREVVKGINNLDYEYSKIARTCTVFVKDSVLENILEDTLDPDEISVKLAVIMRDFFRLAVQLHELHNFEDYDNYGY